MNSYEQILTKGYFSSLNDTEIKNGKVRITVDTRQLFLDTDNERIEITDFVKDMTEEEIRNIFAPLPKFYFASDTNRILIYNNDEWIVCGEKNSETTITESDIVDNLDSTDTNKPLSANQGKVLDESKQDKFSWGTFEDIDAMFAGSYVGNSDISEIIYDENESGLKVPSEVAVTPEGGIIVITDLDHNGEGLIIK